MKQIWESCFLPLDSVYVHSHKNIFHPTHPILYIYSIYIVQYLLKEIVHLLVMFYLSYYKNIFHPTHPILYIYSIYNIHCAVLIKRDSTSFSHVLFELLQKYISRSLGVLLYTLVYGAMPFDGSNFKRLVKQITTGDYYEPKQPACKFKSKK